MSTAAGAGPGGNRGGFVRMFSSAVASQVLLSGGSFLIGLLLIRHVSDLEYGFYMLFTTGLLLCTSLENALIGPFVVAHAHRESAETHLRYLGDIYAEQRRWALVLALGLAVVAVGCGLAGVLEWQPARIAAMGLLATLAALDREYFRIVLLAHQHAERVLRADGAYIVAVLGGAVASIFTPMPVTFAIAFTGLAAAIGSFMMRRQLREFMPWKPGRADAGALREFASSSAWSVAGAGIHWLFSQSYSYLVSAVLGVASVAALGATRLLMMPINLISTGIRAQILPVTTRWLRQHGASYALSRLAAIGLGLALMALCYFGVMWAARDFIFGTILKKQIANRDHLLLLWSAIFLLMTVRDQLIYLPVARDRFRALGLLTLTCALFSMATSFVAMQYYGQIGALMGTLAGESLNLCTVSTLCWLELRRDRRRAADPAATPAP